MIAVCQPLLATWTSWIRGPSSVSGNGGAVEQAATTPAKKSEIQKGMLALIYAATEPGIDGTPSLHVQDQTDKAPNKKTISAAKRSWQLRYWNTLRTDCTPLKANDGYSVGRLQIQLTSGILMGSRVIRLEF